MNELHSVYKPLRADREDQGDQVYALFEAICTSLTGESVSTVRTWAVADRAQAQRKREERVFLAVRTLCEPTTFVSDKDRQERTVAALAELKTAWVNLQTGTKPAMCDVITQEVISKYG